MLLNIFNINMEEISIRRRVPSVERLIKEIRNDDIRVRIIGIVVDIGKDSIVIDDGTGSIKVSVQDNNNFNIGDIVRVIGRVLQTEDGYEINTEFIKNLKNFDIELYKKLHIEWKNFRY